jgi:tetratricopeptide (TPR) repeat protein
MSSRRPQILMVVLLLLLFGYFARPLWQPGYSQPMRPAEPLLPGKNSLSNVMVSQNEAGLWQVNFDYYYTGEHARIVANLAGMQEGATPPGAEFYNLQRGTHHATLELRHPGVTMTTRQVVVTMRGSGGTYATAQVDQLIDWPSHEEWMNAKLFDAQSPEQNLNRAIALIDAGRADSLREAKHTLERLIQRDASFERAYIELARVAMKTNWGPEGLHHAEGLLSSALQIKPDSVDAKILLGYVYTHQSRFKPAEKLFTEAAVANPPNLWLWANWGEMLAMQGRVEPAIAKYREAITRPVSLKTYERAQFDAYGKLLTLLERKKDLDGMEALYKSAAQTFGYSACHSYSLQYARFLLQERGNAQGALEVARKSLEVNCGDQNARELLGLAHYVIWSKSEGAARVEALNQARIYLPPGAKAIYLLAGSEATAKAAAQLVASGENIENKDNDQLNALAHAVQNDDVATARRLLRLGASPATPVGYGEVPVALMPVMSGNLELVKLMRQFGADYAKILYQGATAFDFAKQSGDPELLQAIEPPPRTL